MWRFTHMANKYGRQVIRENVQNRQVVRYVWKKYSDLNKPRDVINQRLKITVSNAVHSPVDVY